MVDVWPEDGSGGEVCSHTGCSRMLTITQVNGSRAGRLWGCTVNPRGGVAR